MSWFPNAPAAFLVLTCCLLVGAGALDTPSVSTFSGRSQSSQEYSQEHPLPPPGTQSPPVAGFFPYFLAPVSIGPSPPGLTTGRVVQNTQIIQPVVYTVIRQAMSSQVVPLYSTVQVPMTLNTVHNSPVVVHSS